MEIVQPVRIDLVGDLLGIKLGSHWVQPFSYFQTPGPGQFVAQVTDIPSALHYTVQLPNGSILTGLPSLDATAWNIGDWVLVEKVYGVWKISTSGAPVLEDLSTVISTKAQVRAKSGDRVLLDFDSVNTADPTLESIFIQPDAATSIKLYAPPKFTIAPAVYKYDLFFYYSAISPYDPVLRQFGDIEISDRITHRA